MTPHILDATKARNLRGLGIVLLCTIALGSARAEESQDSDPPPPNVESTSDPLSKDADGHAPTADELPVAVAEEKPNSRVIEEIIVTATKREVSVRDIAASVTVLTGQQLEDDGLQDIDDIVDAVPGVNLVQNPNTIFKRITMRGISAGEWQNDTVGVFIDETLFTDVFFPVATADVNPFDMSAVEVIKGPVGTLFGGSALNGAIRYIPQQPVLNRWQTKAFSQFSTNSQSEDMGRIFGVAVNIPVFETLALRLVGNDRNSEGWIDSLNQTYQGKDVNSVSQRSLRAILLWQPLDALDLSLMIQDQETLVHDTSFADAAHEGRYERSLSAQPTPMTSGYQTRQLKGTWTLEWADVILVASQSDKHMETTPDGSSLAESDPERTTLIAKIKSDSQPRSQELRVVSSSDDNWDWASGLYNYTYSVFSEFGLFAAGDTTVNAQPLAIIADVAERALFAEVGWRFGGGFELTGGLRFYEFSYLGELETEGLACVLSDPTCPATTFRSVIELDKTERGTNPKLGLKWAVNDQVMSYATAARGFRFGGVNGVAHPEVSPVYDSDSMWSYELGTRAEWLTDSLVTDASLFLIDWSDAQFSTITSDGRAAYVDNVASVGGHGVETQVIWRSPLRGVTLALTSAYAKIEVAEDYTPQTATGPGATTTAGTPWPRAPKWQTAVTLSWDGQFGARQVGASVTHSYFGEAIQGFLPGVDQFPIFGVSTYDFQVAVKEAAGGWWPDLVLNLNNLTNTRGTTFMLNGLGSNSGQHRGYTHPRSASLRLGFEF